MHPSTSRLFQLISRADPTKGKPSVKKLIDDVTDECNTWKAFKSSPLRFKATAPRDRLIFNHTVWIHLVWLFEKPVLHVIDEQTGFRDPCFLKTKSASDIWNSFVACWVIIYVGFPRKICSDPESAITSDVFLQISCSHGIELEFSGVASTILWDRSKAHTGLCGESFGLLQKNTRRYPITCVYEWLWRLWMIRPVQKGRCRHC